MEKDSEKIKAVSWECLTTASSVELLYRPLCCTCFCSAAAHSLPSKRFVPYVWAYGTCDAYSRKLQLLQRCSQYSAIGFKTYSSFTKFLFSASTKTLHPSLLFSFPSSPCAIGAKLMWQQSTLESHHSFVNSWVSERAQGLALFVPHVIVPIVIALCLHFIHKDLNAD